MRRSARFWDWTRMKHLLLTCRPFGLDHVDHAGNRLAEASLTGVACDEVAGDGVNAVGIERHYTGRGCGSAVGAPGDDPPCRGARRAALRTHRERSQISGECGSRMAAVAHREARGVSIRKRGTRSYQVRVTPFPAQTLPTRGGRRAARTRSQAPSRRRCRGASGSVEAR